MGVSTSSSNVATGDVGFLPSIYGGFRISRLLRGDDVSPSIFDPM